MTGEHISSGRFNAGEKSWFWFGVFFLGSVVAITGLILLFPNFGQGRAVMQQAHVIHATAALIYIAVSFGHVYMGALGTEGAYGAMRHGYVDETWAKEHHEYWYNDAVESPARPVLERVRNPFQNRALAPQMHRGVTQPALAFGRRRYSRSCC